jgi:hypothetical protein
LHGLNGTLCNAYAAKEQTWKKAELNSTKLHTLFPLDHRLQFVFRKAHC